MHRTCDTEKNVRPGARRECACCGLTFRQTPNDIYRTHSRVACRAQSTRVFAALRAAQMQPCTPALHTETAVAGDAQTSRVSAGRTAAKTDTHTPYTGNFVHPRAQHACVCPVTPSVQTCDHKHRMGTLAFHLPALLRHRRHQAQRLSMWGVDHQGHRPFPLHAAADGAAAPIRSACAAADGAVAADGVVVPEITCFGHASCHGYHLLSPQRQQHFLSHQGLSEKQGSPAK
jgi:hypothetical protein